MLLASYRPRHVVKKLFLLTAIVVWCVFFIQLIRNNDTKPATVVFVMDVSQSMNVVDITHGNYRISRLDASKQLISGLIVQTTSPTTRGLVLYSSTASYFIPPTQDTGTFLRYLATVNTNILPGGGTNPSSVFSMLDVNPHKNQQIIRYTDGEIGTGKIGSGTKGNIYLIGLGTPQGDVVKDAAGTTIYHGGKPVIVPRNDAGLARLQAILGAKLSKQETTASIDITLNKGGTTTSSSMHWRLFGVGVIAILGVL